MSIFYFNNLHKMPRQDIINKFEEDTNYKFINGVKENHDKIRDWIFTNVNSLDNMLHSEFPKVVIPSGSELVGTSDFLEKWLEKIVKTNETCIIKPKKKLTNIKKDNSFIDVIMNTNIEDLIDNAIQVQCEFDVAKVFYKLLYDKYSLIIKKLIYEYKFIY